MQPQVVIAGGGFGGLEAAFLLRQRLGDRVGITLVSDSDLFVYRPGSVYVPFGLDPQQLLTRIAPPLRRRGIPFLHAQATALDADRRALEVTLADHSRGWLSYDYLVVATGAQVRASDVPGLEAFALGVWSLRDLLGIRRALAQIVRDAREGARRDVLLLVPPGNRWAGPIYEMALMLDSWFAARGVRRRVEISLATHEHTFLEALGSRVDALVRERFARHHVLGYTRVLVSEAGSRSVRLSTGGELPYDLLITFPAHVAAVPFPDLPRDHRGFLLTAGASREVPGAPGVFAVGDASAFPVKQALVAVRQAGAAVGQMECEITGRESPLVENQGIWLMDSLQEASFAQVPLREGGEPPVDLGAESGGGALQYRVGTSTAWRIAKKFVGAYVPWRYRHGLPCHGGLSGALVDQGLRLMAGALAH